MDLYIAVMRWLSPGRDWFAWEAPGMTAALATEKLPNLEAVFARHQAMLAVDADAAGV